MILSFRTVGQTHVSWQKLCLSPHLQPHIFEFLQYLTYFDLLFLQTWMYYCIICSSSICLGFTSLLMKCNFAASKPPFFYIGSVAACTCSQNILSIVDYPLWSALLESDSLIITCFGELSSWLLLVFFSWFGFGEKRFIFKVVPS